MNQKLGSNFDSKLKLTYSVAKSKVQCQMHGPAYLTYVNYIFVILDFTLIIYSIHTKRSRIAAACIIISLYIKL